MSRVASYYALAFALSWGAVLAVIGRGSFPASPDEAARLFPFVYLAMLIGPPVAGIVMTAVTGGRAGLASLGQRLLRWRVGGRWYAVALFTAPLALVIALLALRLFSQGFVPAILSAGDVASGPLGAAGQRSMLVLGLVVGLGAGFFEELGWTGFAIPATRLRHGVLASGLTVGIMWGAWHFLATFWGSADAFGSVPVPLYLAVALFSFLLPYRILMTWVYERTGSLPVAMLMHASLTASMIILGPGVRGGGMVAWQVAVAAVMWVMVLAIARGDRQHLASRLAPPW